MSKLGFTLIELIIVMSIFFSLVGLVAINLLNTSVSTNINTAEQTLISDLRNQQIRAMSGDLGDLVSTKNYGVYFEQKYYTLFQGDFFMNGKSSNFKIKLPDQIEFSDILLPQSQIIFASQSGQVLGFAQNESSFALRDLKGGSKKTFRINKFGVITGVEQ